MRLRPTWTALLPALAGVVLLAPAGCAALKESRASWPVKEYEKIIAGRLDADYVGTAACTAKCHAHDDARPGLPAQHPRRAGLGGDRPAARELRVLPRPGEPRDR